MNKQDVASTKQEQELETVRTRWICIECKKKIEIFEWSYAFTCRHHIHDSCISQGLKSQVNYVSLIKDW